MSEKENEPKNWEEWLHIRRKEIVKVEDNLVDEWLHKSVSEMKGNEEKIINDFLKAFLAAESLLTGKDFVTLMRDFTLNIQYCTENGNKYTKYWLSLKE